MAASARRKVTDATIRDTARSFFVSSRGRHTRLQGDWSSDVCSSDLENGVGYVRRNFLVPVPEGDSWDDLNARLAAACRREFERTGGGRDRPTAALLAADRAAFLRSEERRVGKE